MPLVSASDPRVREIGRLRQQAVYHKRAMNEHRTQLRETMAQLAELEREFADKQTQTGEGVIHGHQHTRS